MPISIRSSISSSIRNVLFGLALLLSISPAVADQQVIDAALQQASQGEVRSAVIQLKDLLQRDPENAQARFALGRIYLLTGDAASAEKELRRAQLLGVPTAEVSELILEAYLAQAKFEEMRFYLQKQQAEDPQLQATFKAFEGFVLMADKQGEQARTRFEEALVLDKNNIRAILGLASYLLQDNQDTEALNLLNEFLASQPNNAKALLLRAELYRKQGTLDKAEADYLLVLEQNPNQHKARLGLAFLQVTQRQPAQALKNIAALPEQMRKSSVVHYLQAVSYFLQGDQDKAEEFLQKVLLATPGHTQSQLLLGVIHYSNQKWQLAEDYLRRVNKQLPGNPSISKLLAATYLKLRQPEKTISLLEKLLLPGDIKDAQLYSLLGSAYLQQGDNSRSQQWFDKAVELAPDQAAMRTQQALGMLAGGDTDLAIDALESAVDMGQDMIQTDVLLVMSHLKTGDNQQAIERSQALQDKYPDNPIAYNLTGLAFLADGQHDKADAAFVQALKIDPGFTVAALNRARNQVAAGKPDAAQQHYQQVLELEPGNGTALLGMAQLAAGQGDQQQQRYYLEQVVANDPGNLLAAGQLAEMHLGASEPLKALTLLTAVSDPDNPAILRLKGMAEISAGQGTSAIATLKRLVSQLPDNIEANFQLGRAYLLNDDKALARRHFAHAAAQDTANQFPIVRLGLAEIDLQLEDWNGALATTDELLEAGQQVATVYELRAAAYQGLGKSTDMLASLKQAYQLEPNTRRVNQLANHYQNTGFPEQAVKVMADWVEQHPEDAATQAVLGLTYQQLDQDKLAMQAYENSLKVQPDNPVIMNNLAWLYHEAGDDRALGLARSAYERAQKRPEIIDTYGWILLQSGQAEQALPILQQALLQSPSHPEIAYHVAVAMQKLGRGKEAEPILRRIIRNSPSSPFADKARAMLDTS